jgi:hypothetical protein
MNRSLADVLAIAKELIAIYHTVAGKTIGVAEGLALGGQVLAVLNKHKVTIEELEQLLNEVGPFLPMLGLTK